jgi:hypothetical protein
MVSKLKKKTKVKKKRKGFLRPLKKKATLKVLRKNRKKSTAKKSVKKPIKKSTEKSNDALVLDREFNPDGTPSDNINQPIQGSLKSFPSSKLKFSKGNKRKTMRMLNNFDAFNSNVPLSNDNLANQYSGSSLALKKKQRMMFSAPAPLLPAGMSSSSGLGLGSISTGGGGGAGSRIKRSNASVTYNDTMEDRMFSRKLKEEEKAYTRKKLLAERDEKNIDIAEEEQRKRNLKLIKNANDIEDKKREKEVEEK